MAIQLSAGVRNAMANQLEATVGTAPKLQIRTGSQPSDTSQSAAGTLLAEITLPSDWLGAASAGAVSKSGTWSGTGSAGGTAGHFRILDSAGTTCHLHGSVTATGGGGDMTLDNTSIANGQTVTISSFSYTRGNA